MGYNVMLHCDECFQGVELDLDGSVFELLDFFKTHQYHKIWLEDYHKDGID